MLHKILLSFTFLFFVFALSAQSNIESSSTWQIENFGSGEKSVFTLVIFDDKQCNASIIGITSSFYSKDCTLGKSTMIDNTGAVYTMSFSSNNNFGVDLTLKGTKNTIKYTSAQTKVNIATNKPSNLPTPPPTPVVAEVVKTKKPKEKKPVVEKTQAKEPKVKEEKIKVEKVKEVKELKVKEVKTKEIIEEVKKEEKVKKPAPAVNVVEAPNTSSKIKSSSNRKILFQPTLLNTCTKEYGTVVFDITLSQNGRVISSKINIGQSNNPSSCLVGDAIDLLQQMRWQTITANYEEDLEVTFDYEKESKKKKKN